MNDEVLILQILANQRAEAHTLRTHGKLLSWIAQEVANLGQGSDKEIAQMTAELKTSHDALQAAIDAQPPV